jgi:hypothetical protein
MAKNQNNSKIAVAGALALALGVAGVIFVQPPLKSTRPPSIGGALKPHVAEGVVQARLWEDPLESARRVATFDGEAKKTIGAAKNDVDRVGAIRQGVDDRIKQDQGGPITVLLVMTEGGASGESREIRIRDRYAIGSALGIACFIPQGEDELSYVEWRDRAGTSRVLPYEWYEQGPRKCTLNPASAQAVLVLWISSEITGDRPIEMLRHLTQSILCERGTIGACRQGGEGDGTVPLDLHREQHVRFKIMGPRSSSGFRNLLEEAAVSAKGGEDHLLWANAGGRVELYSPWATTMPKLLTQGLSVTAKPAESTECVSSDASRAQLCWILLRVGIELKHSIGSDDQLFETLVHELERRRVKFERDAVILIAEWDSFYGRVMPVEFTAAVCHRIAHRPSEENWAIEPDRLALIRSKCDTVDHAIDLQVNDPTGTRGLGLNIWRYSYLRGLDGEVSGGQTGNSAKASAAQSLKDVLLDTQMRERPIGTSQFDYVQRLAASIEREMAEEANLQQVSGDPATGHEEPGRKPPAAIGILGSDAYDALLILQAMRERFPGVVFFTTDLDSRLIYADDYRWTRNLVISSHYGLDLYKLLQRDVPPFRSSYQTSTYFATLQAVGHVRPLADCPPIAGQSNAPAGAFLSSCGYQADRVPDDVWFSGVELPRLFEVGRHGAVDLTVGAVSEGYTLHPPRVDLSNDEPQTSGRRPSSGALYGTVGLAYAIGFVILWTKPTTHRWMTAHMGLLGLGTVGAFGLALAFNEFLLDGILQHHDGGEPFYWLEGVSIWPTELLRALATLLAIGFLIKAWRDLRSNSEEMTDHYGFGVPEETGQAEGWRQYLTMAQWVLSPRGEQNSDQVDALWERYRKAGSRRHRIPRLFLLAVIYAASVLLLWKVTGAEDISGPCRGSFSCRLDLFSSIGSSVCLVVLNLFVFDAVLLCRRWIGLLAQATDGWPQGLTKRLKLQSAENLAKARELMKIELIGERTEIVNRIVRYPFIVLLVLIISRNNYFDDWHFPLTMIAGWSANVFLALTAALLLYRAAEQARYAGVARLNHLVLQGLDRGAAGDSDVKLTRQVIEDIEAVGRGAFVPLWQQPVVESSMYGLLALLQYLYLS